MSYKADNKPKPSCCQKGADYGFSIALLKNLLYFVLTVLEIAAATAFHLDNPEHHILSTFFFIPCNFIYTCLMFV